MAARLAITGASGALGRRVMQAAIDKGYQVVAFGRAAGSHVPAPDQGEADWRHLDLAAPQSCWAAALDGCDAVIHLAAAKSPPNPSALQARTLWETNVVATRGLIAAMRDAGVAQLVLASSAYAFLETSCAPGLGQSPAAPGRILYLGSKAVQEHVSAADCAACDIRFAALRISSVIATGQSAIDSLAMKLARHEPVTLTGFGAFAADFVSACDVAQGLLLAVRQRLAGSFTLSSGRCLTLRTVVDELRREIGADPALVTLSAADHDDPGFPAIDCTDLRSHGYRPEDFRTTLARLVRDATAMAPAYQLADRTGT